MDKGVHEAQFLAHVHQYWTIQVPYAAVEEEDKDNWDSTDQEVVVCVQ